MSLRDQLEDIRDKKLKAIEEINDLKGIDDFRVELLGKQGVITKILRGMKDLPADERPNFGVFANQVRDQFQSNLENRRNQIKQSTLNQQMLQEKIDVTLPGTPVANGKRHVIQQIIDQLENLFVGLGYQILNGPEVEEDRYNFEMMNLPKDHPARDMQDTFYITKDILMRTQTSPMQARAIESHDFSLGSLKMISPGVVYRRDTDDLTHSHQFHQVEGLVIDKHITMADLKGTLQLVIHELFGDRFNVQLRPSYFPFTEPSVEADITCFNCNGIGCAICKYTSWIEVLGAGMVHPNVLKMAGVDPNLYGGFAFGMGPDRFAMLKYGVNDIRNFYLNDERFLTQFSKKG